MSSLETRQALGRALRVARRESGKSQKVVAREVGISQHALSYYETGKREPTFPTLLRLLDAVGLDLAEAARIVRAGG